MIKKIFYIFSYILLFFIISITIVSIILSKHEFLKYIGDKYIKSYGIQYQTIQGSLLSNITLKNIKYKDIFKAKELHISYFLPQLFSKAPRITDIIINNADLYPALLKKDSKKSTSLHPFSISNITLKHFNIHLKDKNISIDTKITGLTYQNKIIAKNIKLLAKLQNKYQIKLQGKIDNNIFNGSGELNTDNFTPYLKVLPFCVKANMKNIHLSSHVKSLKISSLRVKNINFKANYSLEQNKADFSAIYSLSYKGYKLSLKQKGYINKEQNLTSSIVADIKNSSVKLPFEHIKAFLYANKKRVFLKASSKGLKCTINGNYHRTDIAINTLYKDYNISSKATLWSLPFVLKGIARVKNNTDNLKVKYKIDKTTLTLKANLQKNTRTVKLNITSNNINYKNFTAKDVDISILMPHYIKIIAKGDYGKGIYLANAKWYIDKKYLKYFSYTPYPFISKIRFTKNSLDISSDISKAVLKNITLQNIDIKLHYPFATNLINAKTFYTIKKDNFKLLMNQTAKINLQGKFNSLLNATISQTGIKLPFKHIKVDIKGNMDHFTLKGIAKNYTFKAKGDYKKFYLNFDAKKSSLNFLNIPNIFKNIKSDITSSTIISYDPFYIKGEAHIKNSLGKFKAKYKLTGQNRLARVKFTPNKRYKFFKDHDISNFSPLYITLYGDKDSKVLNIDANMLNITLFKKKEQLGGWGNLSSGYFDIKGIIKKDKSISLDIDTTVASLKRFLKESGIFKPTRNFYIDAKAIITSKLIVSKDIIFSSKVQMPWFTAVIDKDKPYRGKDFSLQFTLKNLNAIIDRYSFYIQNHYIYSNKPSKLSFSKNGEVVFKKFYIFDNLTLKGKANLFKNECNLRLRGKNFHYISKEADINANADISVIIKANGKQNFSGKITLLKGVLHIKPKQTYNLVDNDIIIIQNLHLNRSLKRKINIFVKATKPISYEVKDIKLKFIPDFLIYQEEGNAKEYLGMITITKGSIKKSGKKFILQKSRVYLRGATPLNPYLNLNFLYKLPNDIKIKIYIENTLASPLFIFSSNPPMNQNDIMSYILFGKPANNVFRFGSHSGTSISLNSLLYGIGLKKMFQNTTHINIDTLNILSSKDKRFGYEIGLSLNDKVRVIYKNDVISSIIIQYSLSKTIQIDVNVQQSAEGVNLLYTKEF